MQPDQNKGDVMGGGTSSVENVGVVGDFGHSNVVDEDLNTSTKMAAGSLKCGSVRRKCSRKLARKAGFIRRLHGRSRKVGSSDYIVYLYVCVFCFFCLICYHWWSSTAG